MPSAMGPNERAELLAEDLEAEHDAMWHQPSVLPARVALGRLAKVAAAGVAIGLAGAACFATGTHFFHMVHGSPASTSDGDRLGHLSSLVAVKTQAEGSDKCHDAEHGDPCYFSVHWAMNEGIYSHPEWYGKHLSPSSSFGEFQLQLHKSGVKNCTDIKPCNAESIQKKWDSEQAKTEHEDEDKDNDEDKDTGKEAADASKDVPPPGPREHTFYMYRAQSEATYPLENINTADLAGVFWYLHNEVIVATPRKYSIDRIKRYKVTVKNTWEFWNAHKRQFGAFVAYDAGGCTTPICKDIYHQYGFIVGCQVQPLSVAAYLGRHQTNWQCKKGQDECRAPIWYALPGPCPAKGIPNGKIDPDSVDLDVDKYKSKECISRMPGGHCKKGKNATGEPDCTYAYEEAGEIFLNDLVGIDDYNEFWNTSYTKCAREKAEGKLPRDHECRHQKEYDPRTDKGVGTDFWNGKLDTDKCTERMDKARKLFKEKFPEFPEHLDEPACEFDMYYDGEFSWKVNHTGAKKSEWWEDRM